MFILKQSTYITYFLVNKLSLSFPLLFLITSVNIWLLKVFSKRYFQYVVNDKTMFSEFKRGIQTRVITKHFAIHGLIRFL